MSLYVQETGTRGAPSVVFLHGIGTSGWTWGRQIAALADFHCLNVDLPGHGRSNQVEWLSLVDTADQVAALIRQRALNGRAHVVGLSLGGYVALALLERHPDRLDHVVISGVTAAPMPNRAWLRPQLALMSLVMRRRWVVDLQAKALPLTADERRAFTENWLAMSMQTYRRIYEECADFAVSPPLGRVSTPTLVTAGGDETEIITQAVAVISKLMPNAQGWLAPGCGHGWNVQAPELFNALLRAWISDAPLPHDLHGIA
jgi:pimeloyl-ACP methyl ester carboxylesterase